jgi:ABC-type phosphate transport system substrate-binding protein
MYTSGEPTGPLAKYLEWVMSDTGQCIMQDKGYAAVRAISCK